MARRSFPTPASASWGEADVAAAMRSPAYWSPAHPDRSRVAADVRAWFERHYGTGPVRRDATGRQAKGEAAGSSSGTVHVHAHTREGGKVAVDAHDRRAPPRGFGGTRQAQARPSAEDRPDRPAAPARAGLPPESVLARNPKALASPLGLRVPGVLQAQAQAAAQLLGLGRSPAARLYWHYLDGSGEDVWLTRDEARAFLPVREAEKEAEGHFAARTFRGETDDGEAGRFLRRLREGETADLPQLRSTRLVGEDISGFDHNSGGRPGSTPVGDAIRAPGDYAAIGRTSVKGVLTRGTARREGDRIFIKGQIEFGLDDTYDFHAGQPGAAPAPILERHGLAHTFQIRSRWHRKVEATLPIVNGTFGAPEVRWQDVD
jgi:hypothetical protein